MKEILDLCKITSLILSISHQHHISFYISFIFDQNVVFHLSQPLFVL